MDITFDVGDAEDLSYPDASFDVVLSTLGVMFCPNQEQAVGELLRVCRPGGKIGLASWTPDGFIGNMLKTVGKHVPPPPGVKPAPLWGTEERLRELFGDGISSLEATRRTYAFRYPSAEYFVEYFRNYYGPTVRAFAALEPEGQEALARDLQELLESQNTSGDETLVVRSDYLEAVAVRR
jgi:ubiquinone/menaquinone biosynthesis C-methylase UbiE